MTLQTARARHTRHGMTHHPVYMVWCGMRVRCGDPKGAGKNWSSYGGRGISVCAAWQQSFAAFWADMGPTWAPGLTLERIDNNGNYEMSPAIAVGFRPLCRPLIAARAAVQHFSTPHMAAWLVWMRRKNSAFPNGH